jgi:hypothetical protein
VIKLKRKMGVRCGNYNRLDPLFLMSNAKAAGKTQGNDGDLVPRNEFGGVYVDEEELRAAFDFFDVNKKGTLVGVYFCSAPALCGVACVCPARTCKRTCAAAPSIPAQGIAHASEPSAQLPCSAASDPRLPRHPPT